MMSLGFAACADHMGMMPAPFDLHTTKLGCTTQMHDLEFQYATNLKPNMHDLIFWHATELKLLFRYFEGPIISLVTFKYYLCIVRTL